MRTLTWSLLVLLAACGEPQPASTIDEIEIGRASIWGGVLVKVKSDGSVLVDRGNGNVSRTSVSPEQFANLVERLDPFRQQSIEPTDANVSMMLNSRCPHGTPTITDRGVITVSWTEENLQRVYVADLECDTAQNRVNNTELTTILETLRISYR